MLILTVLGEGTSLLPSSFPPIAEGSGRKQFCEHLRMCSKIRKLNSAEISRDFLLQVSLGTYETNQHWPEVHCLGNGFLQAKPVPLCEL